MPLESCDTCGSPVATNADACPKCGSPDPSSVRKQERAAHEQRFRRIGLVLTVLGAIAVLGFLISAWP